jgi:hypothetical protein
MNANKLSFAEAKQIPITDYLSGLGFEPAKTRGYDLGITLHFVKNVRPHSRSIQN